jgi:hypothetical protein
MNIHRIALLMAACGVAAGVQAQPRLIVGSGATLQENFFRADASTNDFIDVDGDGRAGSLGGLFPDQLSPNFGGCLTPPFQCGDGPSINDTQWLFLYRITGSGNGVLEFDTFSLLFDEFGDGFDTDGNGTPNNDPGNSIFAEAAVWNRLNLIIAGILQPFGNTANRGGSPFLPIPGTFFPGVTGDGSGAGLHVDFSASDVPLTWFGIVPGDNSPIRAPGSAGYGGNPRTALAKDGTPLDQDNLLRPLTNLNINLSNPDSFTAYDFPVSVTPVAAPVNYGVGMSEIRMSDLRHLSATGRRINGENLIKVTRDSGSGTRNAFMNTIGLDPSFGIGENIGLRTTLSLNDLVGPNYQPSNKGGSSRVDATVANTRLGVGHTGAERLIENGLLLDQRMDTLAIISDIKGGTVAARPTIENVIDGGPNGYNVSGPAAFTFRGDPRNAPAALGGWGWDPSETGSNPFAGNPVPANPAASAYWNNIRRSIAAFVEIPGGPTTDFMPGELLAQSYLLTAAPSQVPTDFDADGQQPIEIIANPNLNPNVQNFSLNDPGSVFASPLMENFNFNTAGRVPTRTANITYTDGNTGNHYVTVNGTLLAYNTILPNSSPNKIAGDFNNDGARDIDDLAPMVAAWRSRNGGPAWTGSGLACFELLGDHDMDGNFTMNDIRYAADGLAMVSAEGGETVLNRFLGFKAVDDAFAGNFFGTSLIRGTYSSGASAADIAGSNATPGWAPNGWDGVVDCADIQYVIDNFGDWNDIEQAVRMDLSADMNGDLVVDGDDVDFVLGVLETVRGDLNFDGVVDAADVAILTANLGTGTTYCEGDLNFDGVVDEQDLALIALGCNAADLAEPFGILDLADIIAFSDAFVNQNAAADLAPPQGVFDLADINAFVSAFTAGCP